MDLSNISNEDLEKELRKRNKTIVDATCPTCKKWPMEALVYSSWNKELHCVGCMKPIARCTC